MSQLPKEYQAIADAFAATGNYSAEQSVRNAVERCYALACKPVRELTDGECYKLWCEIYGGQWDNNEWAGLNSGTEVIRAIIFAHQRKQTEPETVTFRAARHKADNRVSMLQVIDDANIASCWELPEPAQTIEVKLP